MAPKRKLDFGPATPAKNAKKITALSRRVTVNKSEVKFITGQVTAQIVNGAAGVIDMTEIAAGSSYGQRVGNTIRVKRVAIIGSVGGQNVDLYLYQAKNAVALAYGTFVPVIGGEIRYPTYKDNYVLWHHHLKTIGSNSNINYRKSFSFPIKVLYSGDGATSCTNNRMLLIIKNNTGSNITPNLYYKVEYYDN